MHELNVVVTGGASGLGFATVRAFVAQGARAVIADIDLPAAARAQASLAAQATRACAVHCDVADAAACARLVERAEAFFGAPIDVFLANAGEPFGGALVDASPERIRRVIDVNVTGSILSAQAALPSLLRSPRGGCLLFTASLQSVMGRAERSVYTASKHAIAGLVKALALELGPRGMRVNAVAPTLVDTPFMRNAYAQAGIEVEPALRKAAAGLPLGRIPTVDDFAQAVLFLASSAAASITGQVLMVDAGASAGKF